MNPTHARTPVTVLTGFLGAGKTTLLNRILSERHGQRIAVIENEFGELGIDNDLVVHADEEIFEMNNGCLCCTVRGDLVRILGNLMKRRDKFDAILVETTGLADPGPVIQTFFADEEVSEKTWIDGIVTVVDAQHFLTQEEQSHEAEEQVAFADVIVLNKVDLAGEQTAAKVEARLHEINPTAKVLRSSRAQVPIDQIVGIQAFSLERALEIEPELLTHEPHDHSDVGSVGIELVGELDEQRASRWLSEYLQLHGADVFRMKGILSLKGRPLPLVFQGVHMTTDMSDGSRWPDQQRKSRLVFIGRKLNRAELEAGLRSCLA